jgi:hypothetical protein
MGVTDYTGLDVNANYFYTKGSSTNLVGVAPSHGFTLNLTADGYFTGWSEVQILGTVTGSSVKALKVIIPVKFLIHLGRAYILADDNEVYLYGGTDNNTFDANSLIVETPYLDDKTPATGKQAIAIDVAIEGAWTIYGSMDPKSKGTEQICATGDGAMPDMDIDSPFDAGAVSYVARGTHFKLRAESSPVSPTTATLSGLILHYNPEDAT